MQQPKISVIVPVYNVSKYLAKCLDSILRQTIKDIEVILVNDYSPDDKDDVICQEYANKDNRIVYVKNEVNSGVSFSRNYGLKIAKGEYISFVDSDDYLLDDKVYQTCYNKLKEDAYDFVSFSVAGVDVNYNLLENIWFKKEIYNHFENKAYYSNDGFLDKAHFYKEGGNFLSVHSVDKIYKKELLLKNKIEFSLDLKIGEDRLFCMTVYHNARKIYTIKSDYYAYLQNLNSATKKIDNSSVDSYLAMANAEYKYLIDNNLFDLFKDRFLFISLLDTLRNINNKIKRFTDTLADEMRLQEYFTSKLKSSFLIDLLLNDSANFSILFRRLESKQSDLTKIKDSLKSIIKKFFTIKWHLSKIRRIESKIYLKLIKAYGKYHKLAEKNIWLVSERDDEANDNGYAMFRHLRENYADLNVYYFIKFDNKNNDYLKVKKLGNLLNVGSFKALAYYYYAKYCFSTQTELFHDIFRAYSGKNNYKNPLRYCMDSIRKSKKNIFLQHGITKDYLPKRYFGNICRYNYFVAGAFKEYQFLKTMIEDGKYTSNPIYTGFARYDYLDDLSKDKKQILLMPTWRRELVHGDLKGRDSFLDSDYYKTYQGLINNKELIALLENSGYQLVFFPHYEVNSRFINTFSTSSKHIIIAKTTDYDVADLIKTSKLMITDYSSVFWDFAYLQKPIIYYQFDKEFFRATQYKEGYFSYERDGFGDVLETESSVVDKIAYYFKSDFKAEPKYVAKIKEHFTYNDKNNCKRILEAIGFDFHYYMIVKKFERSYDNCGINNGD